MRDLGGDFFWPFWPRIPCLLEKGLRETRLVAEMIRFWALSLLKIRSH